MKQIILAILCAFSLSLHAESQKLTGELLGNTTTWTGLDLGTPHIIDQVTWTPLNSSAGDRSVRLGVFEGANEADFSDGVPLYLIPEDGKVGVVSTADIKVTRAFRYVRYITPNQAKSKIAKVEFFGHEATETTEKEVLYQPTNLPCVVVHVEGEKEPQDKVNDLVSSFSIISNNGKKELHQPGTFRLRGNASMTFDKKPYRIKFDKKQNVLDAPAKAKKWTLIANYGDKTLMRNIVGFELSRCFGQRYTPYIQPVDVFVNGEYKGCYQLCDQVEVGKGRVDIDEMNPEDISGEALTGGYFIEVDAYAEYENSKFKSKNDNPVTIKYPDEDDIKLAQKVYITAQFNKLESLVFSENFDSETDGYRQMFDLESFLTHFLIGELNGNTDTYWSLYLYKYRNDDHFYTGPVWDLDLAFDNDNRTFPINDLYDWIYATKGSIAGKFNKFVSRIVKDDKKAKAQMEKIWADARRNRFIHEQSLFDFIDQTAELLNASQDLNFKRWDIMNRYVHQNPRVWGSYEAEVANIKDYVSRRLKKMDFWLHFDATSIDEVSGLDNTEPTISAIYNLQGLPVESISNASTYIYKYSDGSSKIVTIQ